MDLDTRLSGIENIIGYVFKDKNLLKSALTHSSYANEIKVNKWEDYQRLEYLGDAVLELVSSEFLYRNNPGMKEGTMSKTRASMVCEQSLAYSAFEMHLDEYILLGKGEESCGGRKRNSIVSDVFEAIIGAIYIDGGFEKAKSHVENFLLKDIDEKQLFIDSKSRLQEMIQASHSSNLRYELVGESGPEHEKEFEMALYINDKLISTAKGRNKKETEQKAAYEAIKILMNEQ